MTEPAKTTAVDDARKVLTEDFAAAARDFLQAQVGRLQAFWNDQAVWSQATFGTDAERGPMGALKHLEKEARECQDAPSDLEEKADCLLLIFDATRRSGRSLDDLLSAAEAKLEKNKGRSWGKSTPDEPVEHERDALATCPAPDASQGKP